MRLTTTIEYFTRWGENLVIRSAAQTYPMRYVADGVWIAEIDLADDVDRFDYHYELIRDGFMVRREWGGHSLKLSGKSRKVKDEWKDVPANLPLQNAVFSDGKSRFAGVAIPVFSLRSEESFGVGEFNDLKKMVDWAEKTGQRIIQLLPINDTTMTGTWQDSYPYNANSTFALHPQFINLPAVGVKVDKAYKALRAELNAQPYVDYERVNNEKTRLLREAFAATWEKVSKSAAYKKFYAANIEWLLPYAAFCTLRDQFGTPDFHEWKGYAVYDKKKVEKYCASHTEDISFHCFVQYHLHTQLVQVCKYAHSHGVILKGDLPIGISRTSVDAWIYPELFHLDSQAGAPPDAFSADGQNWGFPTYNWERMELDGFAWWKARLRKMSEYFYAFRIDHILGFFRIWEIPVPYKSGLMGHFSPALPYSADELRNLGFDVLGGAYITPLADETDVLFVEDPRKKGYYHPRIGAQNTSTYAALPQWQKDSYNTLYNDFFYYRHNASWKESALRKLPDLLSSTGMITCGEDLGMIPACVPEVMEQLQILSLEIQRMPKSMEETFANVFRYPHYSVGTTSTHDMNPTRAWWEEDRQISQRFYNEMLGFSGQAPYFCEPWICRRIVEQHLASPSMFVILPLQDYLAIDGDLRYGGNPADERINVPAIPRYYWRYRMHLTLETLLAQEGFNDTLRGLIAASGR